MEIFGFIIAVGFSIYISGVTAFFALFGGEEFSSPFTQKRLWRQLATIILIILCGVSWHLTWVNMPFTVTTN